MKCPPRVITLIYLPTRCYYYVFMYSFTHKLKSCQFFFCPNPHLVFIFDILILQRDSTFWNGTKRYARNLLKKNLFRQQSMLKIQIVKEAIVHAIFLICRCICKPLWTLSLAYWVFYSNDVQSFSSIMVILNEIWVKWGISKGKAGLFMKCELWNMYCNRAPFLICTQLSTVANRVSKIV